MFFWRVLRTTPVEFLPLLLLASADFVGCQEKHPPDPYFRSERHYIKVWRTQSIVSSSKQIKMGTQKGNPTSFLVSQVTYMVEE